jgi:4-amino-4-deoxy-L-arabinose transferase-like glycosyltransferase
MTEPTEPTVLDYFKSIFKSRDSFSAFLRAWSDSADTTSLVKTSPSESGASPAATTSELPITNYQSLSSFPWRSLLALFIALIAQRAFEPPAQSYTFGTGLYLIALGLGIWAFLRGELTPASLPASERHTDPLTIHGWAFLLSLVFGAATYLLMSDLTIRGEPAPFWWPTEENTFNSWNLSVWLIAILFHMGSLWLSGPQSLLAKIADFISSPKRIQLTRWGLAILGVVALTLFFRFYRLETVVPEMTSDHAEKLFDVYDIVNGRYPIFFERNTGREPLYVYLSALLVPFTGVSFLTIKLSAVLGGLLMLPYLYLLGKELGSKRIGLLAVAFAGIGYWPNVIERFALRISFYPLFVAPVLYYLIRGLRRQNRNDFLLAGVMLGLGLNGYTPFRIMPFVVVAIVIVYLLHVRDAQTRKQVLTWLGMLALTAWVFFIPLARYAVEHPDAFGFRALSRLSSIEQPLPGPAWQIFLDNVWVGLKQFNVYDGQIWVHSIPGRPSLDIVAGALFLLGAFLLLARYLKSRHWVDLAILLSVPLTQLPSTLSLAFPDENPSLNRAAGALVPAFLIVGVGLDGALSTLGRRPERVEGAEKRRAAIAWGLAGVLVAFSSFLNYDLVFRQYNKQYTDNAWNTKEMGEVMKNFAGPIDNVWIVPYPYWVDTRLAPIWAGAPGRDIAVFRDHLADTLTAQGPKLFMVKIEDTETLVVLQTLYPNGQLRQFDAAVDGRDFWIFTVP